ncbi:MAG: hypothetical protein U0174_04520 [Polyangiaceae bacterium]
MSDVRLIPRRSLSAVFVATGLAWAVACSSSAPVNQDGGTADGGDDDECTNAIHPSRESTQSKYPLHKAITASVFWVGEDETTDNGFIHNRASAWQEDWEGDYGGVDDPEKRRGFYPASFSPKQNPFYFALPYNDFDEDGKRKPNVATLVPWYDANVPQTRSLVKDRWVEVSNGDRHCFGQWEDVGPYLENDEAYVFGGARPANNTDPSAGIDLSPAMATCLCIDGLGTVTWRFMDEADVPPGPWLQVVTKP